MSSTDYVCRCGKFVRSNDLHECPQVSENDVGLLAKIGYGLLLVAGAILVSPLLLALGVYEYFHPVPPIGSEFTSDQD